MSKSPFPRRRAIAHLVMYSIDLGIALTAFIFGFGLTVHNWWVLIGLGILSRWIFHVGAGALMAAQANERAAESLGAGKEQA